MEIDQTIEVSPGVWALGGLAEITPSVSWTAATAHGWLPIQCYLIQGECRHLLIDAGVPAHEKTVLAGLTSLLGTADLALLFTRIVEFDSLGNGASIAFSFSVTECYAHFDARGWLVFDPKHDLPNGTPRQFEREPLYRTIKSGEFVSVDETDRVHPTSLEVIHAPLRLLATAWLYDPIRRILFTSDSFSHASMPTKSSARIVDAETDRTTLEDARAHLYTKFDWLSRANTASISSDLASIFEARQIDVLAPTFGCIIKGRGLVKRHYEMVQAALAAGPPDGAEIKRSSGSARISR